VEGQVRTLLAQAVSGLRSRRHNDSKGGSQFIPVTDFPLLSATEDENHWMLAL
jgi:hypothetical protein